MKNTILFIFTAVIFFTFSCSSNTSEENLDETSPTLEETTQEAPKRKFPSAKENGKFFTADEKRMMYGGEDSTWHFDVSNLTLKEENFHFGIGREKFHALIKPQYISVEEAKEDTAITDTSRFLFVNINGDARAYSVDLLTHHEIVNDVVGGEPIMAAYCVLADLGAIYTRKYGNKVFTFALSGYTYFDENVWDGLDGFVFWDRETESTWWPLIGKAVSGPMINAELVEYNKENWEDITWAEIKAKNISNLKVLKSGQTMEAPKSWKKLNDKQIEEIKAAL
ncbi:MAG: hypothetical protein COW67_00915 [Flavobacteriales bacterium CG18_big_fil_WC_8_21_14_2_50_32_9]|nr:DUF3179 domain-containing protein [Flavobacteriales bacterium]PIQ16831.1 MAG: hypothetical protein COW67_00915 [Flavobacteriales bacterium CG18_big_fil_WC_8_21_14_2_50_32_9]